MNWTDGEYRVSDDKTLLSIERIQEFLAKSYWASDRRKDTIELTIQNSLCFGMYHQGLQIGFARVVTDMATMYYLADVFIDEAYRGRGLGKRLVQSIVESEPLRDLAGILGTRDAHGLYEKFGFTREPEKLMRRRP